MTEYSYCIGMAVGKLVSITLSTTSRILHCTMKHKMFLRSHPPLLNFMFFDHHFDISKYPMTSIVFLVLLCIW